MDIKLFSLIRHLQKPGGVTVPQLCKELNVSRATVYRYLEVIQSDELLLPVTSEQRGRYVYYFFDMSDQTVGRNVFENMPLLKDDFFFDKDEKMLIEYIFSHTESTVPVLKSNLKKLHKKMEVLLSFAGHVSNSEDISDNSVIKRRAVRKIDDFNEMPKKSMKDKLPVVSTLCDAVAECKVCIVTYKAINKDEAKTYRFMPLVVFSYQGGIYTIGETDKYDYSCKLAVERILKIEMLDEKFKRKTTIDIPWIMTDPFGLVQIDQFEAEIMIPKDSVERIMDKAWPEKRVRFSSPADDGSVVMTVITSGEFELIRWLRYMGGEVKLLSPSWLVEKLKKSIDALKSMYE